METYLLIFGVFATTLGAIALASVAPPPELERQRAASGASIAARRRGV